MLNEKGPFAFTHIYIPSVFFEVFICRGDTSQFAIASRMSFLLSKSLPLVLFAHLVTHMLASKGVFHADISTVAAARDDY